VLLKYLLVGVSGIEGVILQNASKHSGCHRMQKIYALDGEASTENSIKCNGFNTSVP
jgi:hypothetical protein